MIILGLEYKERKETTIPSDKSYSCFSQTSFKHIEISNSLNIGLSSFIDITFMRHSIILFPLGSSKKGTTNEMFSSHYTRYFLLFIFSF